MKRSVETLEKLNSDMRLTWRQEVEAWEEKYKTQEEILSITEYAYAESRRKINTLENKIEVLRTALKMKNNEIYRMENRIQNLPRHIGKSNSEDFTQGLIAALVLVMFATGIIAIKLLNS